MLSNSNIMQTTTRWNSKSVDVTVQPVNLAVPLADMKELLKIDGTDEDDLITNMIKGQTKAAENYTGLCFITQTLVLTMDGFGGSLNSNYPQRS